MTKKINEKFIIKIDSMNDKENIDTPTKVARNYQIKNYIINSNIYILFFWCIELNYFFFSKNILIMRKVF